MASVDPNNGTSRPKITAAQIVASVPVLAALLSAFGVYDFNPVQQEAVEDAINYAIALVGADAILRGFRNYKDAQVEAARQPVV